MAKKIIVLFVTLVVSLSGMVCAATSYGMAPDGVSGPRAKMLARRAAIAGMYRETGGKTMHILSERWDGKVYEINF